jgi:hypothetical protein
MSRHAEMYGGHGCECCRIPCRRRRRDPGSGMLVCRACFGRVLEKLAARAVAHAEMSLGRGRAVDDGRSLR